MKPAPSSVFALYSPRFKGKITVPNNPIQIADAALYLSRTRPSLGIKDPYELTKPQFDATIALLKKQRPLVKKYWSLASDEVSLFKNGDVDDRRRVAVHDRPAPGREGPGAGDHPEGGRDGLAGHVDAVVEGEAPQLRVRLVHVHLQLRGCRLCRRSPGVRRR